MALDRLATDIWDFYPDSPDYDEMNYEAMREAARDRIADRNNELIVDLAEKEADISAMNTATQISNMDAASSAGLTNNFLSGALALGGGIVSGGADAGWFDKGASTPTLGLGDGFSIGDGQAGLDPVVDLDRYLQSGGSIVV